MEGEDGMTVSGRFHHAVRARVDPRLTGTRTFFYTYIALLGCLAEIVCSLLYSS